MKYTLKTRLIGAALLAAIALIFLPSFFKDKDVAPVSTKTQIPPKPTIAAEDFKAPQPISSVEPAPAPETMFMPDQQNADQQTTDKQMVDQEQPPKPPTQVVSADAPVASNVVSSTRAKLNASSIALSSTATREKSAKQNPSATTPVAHLGDKGVPDAWMIQVGSFATKEAADKIRDQLQAHGMKAFDRKVSNINGVAAKVFVGPVLEKAQAVTIKKQVDHELKVNSLVVKFQP